jgi:hypothetical protein
MPTIKAASTPSRNVTTRAENIRLRFDYENEIQFQFRLENCIEPGRVSQQLENKQDQNGNEAKGLRVEAASIA